MNRILFGTIASVVIAAINICPVLAASYRVTKVVDGDTIMVQVGKKLEAVRLVGIDAPELSSGIKTKKGCFATQARDFLSKKLVGKYVTLSGDWLSGDKDYYGRLLRYVYLKGEDINRTLVLKGYARQYKFWNNDYLKRADYTLMESVAMISNRGLWNKQMCPMNR